MDLESYLIEEKSSIIAINQISKIIDYNLRELFPDIIKGTAEESEIYNIIALNNAIKMVAYCMRLYHRHNYLEIEPNYHDEFSYDSIMYEM